MPPINEKDKHKDQQQMETWKIILIVFVGIVAILGIAGLIYLYYKFRPFTIEYKWNEIKKLFEGIDPDGNIITVTRNSMKKAYESGVSSNVLHCKSQSHCTVKLPRMAWDKNSKIWTRTLKDVEYFSQNGIDWLPIEYNDVVV